MVLSFIDSGMGVWVSSEQKLPLRGVPVEPAKNQEPETPAISFIISVPNNGDVLDLWK